MVSALRSRTDVNTTPWLSRRSVTAPNPPEAIETLVRRWNSDPNFVWHSIADNIITIVKRRRAVLTRNGSAPCP